MRSIVKDIHINKKPESVFHELVTPSSIRKWWHCHRAIVMPRKNGIWALAWGANEDSPEYQQAAEIASFQPGRRLKLRNFRYASKMGSLPFADQIELDVHLNNNDSGSILRLTQSGFPEDQTADEFFELSQKGWDDTLEALKAHCEGS